MQFSKEDCVVLAKMGDAFVEDGSWLIEENGECPLMRRILKAYPELEPQCPWLVHFLEHGEPPQAKRTTAKMLRERNKKSKTTTLSKKKIVKKKRAKKKT